MDRIAGLRWCVMSLGMLIAASAHARGAVGRTAGEASVAATGSARYSIPLSLPPGTHGLAPALAITYDSRSGNGLLGVGFRLTGFSKIERCASTLAQDGRLAAVALDAGDRFCLDGQRLRLAAGVHGQPGAEYRTEVESFVRVTAHGAAGSGPAWFRAEQRNGLVYEYGATDDSRIESSGSVTPRTWAVSRILDRSGNYVAFRYVEDATDGAFRPARIDYAGNTRTGTAPYYSVRFAFEARPADDRIAGYLAGGVVREASRLARIDVVHVATEESVRSYGLAYDAPASTGRSRLARVQECARTTCLPATRFDWSGGQPGWAAEAAVPLAADLWAGAVPGDMDGDGFDDVAYYDPARRSWWVLRGSAAGFATSAVDTRAGADSAALRAVSADLDGDGRRDVLVPQGGWWQWLRSAPSGGYAYISTGLPESVVPGAPIVVDVDGDGRDDLVYRSPGGDALRWRRSLASATTPLLAAEATLWTAPPGATLATTPFVQQVQRHRSAHRSADVNGDGRADLLVLTVPAGCTGSYCVSNGRWHVLASSGTALVSQANFDGASDALLADFNADGLTDVAFAIQGEPWRLLLGAGSRGAALATMHGPVPTAVANSASPLVTLATDWNGDGRTDLVQLPSGGAATVCRSDGATLPGCEFAATAPAGAVAAPAILDVNGDSAPDVVYSVSGALRWMPGRQAGGDLLVRVTDGLGAESTFTYAPLTSTTAHAAATAATFPVRGHVRPGRAVVAATRATSSGTRRESYFYEGARVHAQGRGFLGFERRTTRDLDSGLTRVEQFMQDPAAFDRIGALTNEVVRQSSGRLLANTSYRWSRHVFGSGYEARAFPYVSSLTADRHELDGVHVARVDQVDTVDPYGTVVRRYVSTQEVAKGANPGARHIETTTLGGVVNDVQAWCLGRPATTQVSREHNLPAGAQAVRNSAHAWDYAQCRPAQHVVEPASSSLRVTTGYAYDAHGNLASVVVTPVGEPARTTAYDWGADGRFLLQVTNAEGHVSRTEWDATLAVPARVIDANGLVTRLQYDDLGREIRRTRPDGTSTSTSRSDCASDCAWPDARYSVRMTNLGVGDVHLGFTEAGYDRHDRAVYSRAELPAGRQVLRARRYDQQGRLMQESLPADCCVAPPYWVLHSYDLLGRRVRQYVPGGPGRPTPAVTSWRHDGLTVTETDPLGRDTVRTHNAVGGIARVVDAALSATHYDYDAFGNVVRVRDARGAEVLATYDARGRRTSLLDPSAGLWLYGHAPLGELKWQTNARGQVTSFAYDRLSRPVTRTEPEGITTWTWGQSPEARNVGALAAVHLPGFAQTYAYDNLGRPGSVTVALQAKSFVTAMTYDPVTGLRDVLTYPAPTGSPALRVRHHHDRGRLVELTDADTGASYWRLDALDARGHVTGESLGNGVRVASQYDPVSGLLTERTAGIGGGSSHQNLVFEWDAAGNLVRRTERNAGVEEGFAYDALDRLDTVQRAGVLSLDLAYDPVGNLTYKSDVGEYRYDPVRRDKLVAAGPNTYEHDANGAVVKASGTIVHWFSFDLPSRIRHPAGNYSVFEYGPDRARTRQLALAAGTATETIYAANGLYEWVQAGGRTKHRHYIVADGRRVAVHTRSDGAEQETVYLLEDHLGGVDGFTDADGELLSRLSYKPFGAHRGGDWLGSAPTAEEWQQIQSATPRGYTDHEHLNNLGVIHMNGRVYDPVLGRFLSPDPIVQAPHDTQGLNRYAYVRNNPLRYTDPSGFCYESSAGNGSAQQCMEEIEVSATRLGDGDFWRFIRQSEDTVLVGTWSDAGAALPEGVTAEALEEVVVTAPRPPGATAVPFAAIHALMPNLIPYLQSVMNSRYFGDALLVGTMALALLEPSPLGEVAAISQAATSTSRALVPYYPSGNGFIGATTQMTLTRGTVIDRFGGSAYSQFFSPVGTSMSARALPPVTATQPLRTFEVLAPFEVQAGRVAPWFGQPGLGMQFRSQAPLGELLESKLLKELGP